MDASIAIATYGDPEWRELAMERAIPSALMQVGAERVIWEHGESLHEARNAAVERVETEWVIHLDADDELLPGYVEAMSKGSADLRAPYVSYIRKHHAPRGPGMPKVYGHKHVCSPECLPVGNWMVIGTAVRTAMVLDVGGWRDFPWSEDWDLWLRCWKAGASIEAIPCAVYRAHVRFDSRNRGATQAAKNAAHQAIYEANFGATAA